MINRIDKLFSMLASVSTLMMTIAVIWYLFFENERKRQLNEALLKKLSDDDHDDGEEWKRLRNQ